jgi:hypothetical protein
MVLKDNFFENILCKIKQDGKFSIEFKGYKGSRQGHKKGHFKTYINPSLTAANSSELGSPFAPSVCLQSVSLMIHMFFQMILKKYNV